MNIRQPIVAGRFYPADKETLLAQVDGYLQPEGAQSDVVAAIMPHAGYMYSGKTAGVVASAIRVPDTVILLGPKHTWAGADAAVSPSDAWHTPVGDIPLDVELARELARSPFLELDALAHQGEHSLEVELPFLWRRNPSLRIVPIALHLRSLESLDEVAAHIAETIEKRTPRPLIVASTDMSHQISADEAHALDHMAIDRILALDGPGLLNTVQAHRISMCGVIPVTVALLVATRLGASEATLLSYTHSGEATGDNDHVVGYAGITVR